MRIGNLRHLATIENLVKRKDSLGGKVEAWEQFSSAWCSIRPVSGSEKWYSSQRHAEVTHQIILRFIGGVKPTMRIKARGRVFDIVSVINMDERDKTLLVAAKEVLDD